MKRTRRATEAEVIAEFLKNEFYEEEFHHDRDRFEHLVMDADVTDEYQNALRRALLFRRRGHMWRELPPDTQWWEIQLEAQDLEKVFVFPRAHWRKLADGDFRLPVVVDRIRARRFPGKIADFISKIQSLSYHLRFATGSSSVMLIGIDEHQPMVIIEGNHRLTAALLNSPGLLENRFRVYFGVSPKMTQSCWYRTNFPNLVRYAKNRLRHLWYDREADIQRLLPMPEPDVAAAEIYGKAVTAGKAMPESK